LRTRNLAYPPSRQMNFRIGITIGDVVERNGDLLGDGVNIAARLEGLAQVGGICVSRAVFEQVANKLSVHFADIGEQQVKNIPRRSTLSWSKCDATTNVSKHLRERSQ
jgi:adenylate cyclase